MNFYTVAEDRFSLTSALPIPSVDHVSLSPFYPEAVYVEQKEDDLCRVMLWSPDGQTESLYSDWDTRFTCIPDIRTVRISLQPHIINVHRLMRRVSGYLLLKIR